MVPPPLTASGLTGALRRGGSLARGEVLEVRLDRQVETWVSHLAFIKASYSADAPADLPTSLVIKWPRALSEESGGVDNAEVEFYARLAPALPSPPIVRCLAAVGNGVGGGALVLEDLRDSHDHPPWPIPPSPAQSEVAIDALARIHATWWEDPSLGDTIGTVHTAESLRMMVHEIGGHLPGFLDAVGDALPREGRATLERVFASALQPWLRLVDPHAQTVVHGDAHTWNFLFPRSGTGPAYLVDWQLWHRDVGARDVAFLIALHWPPSRRSELELELLRHYHARLLELGVPRYPFDELLLDYRRGVVRNLTFPVLFWKRGMAPERWWHRLDYALAAYRDLNCDELL